MRGLVALVMDLGGQGHRTVLCWTWAFGLIAVVVTAVFALSAVGGIGGKSGHSMWWGYWPWLEAWPVKLKMLLFLRVAGQQMLRQARQTDPVLDVR